MSVSKKRKPFGSNADNTVGAKKHRPKEGAAPSRSLANLTKNDLNQQKSHRGGGGLKAAAAKHKSTTAASRGRDPVRDATERRGPERRLGHGLGLGLFIGLSILCFASQLCYHAYIPGKLAGDPHKSHVTHGPPDLSLTGQVAKLRGIYEHKSTREKKSVHHVNKMGTGTNTGNNSQTSTGNNPVIDAVFLYVNGSDPELQNQARSFGKEIDPSRIRDFGQLRYAMRSAFINAPFIRNFIVVVNSKSSHIPSWLDTSHPRIRVFEHSEIWDDPSDLPSMNTAAIEWATMNIPGISQLYLYFNDDFAIQKPLNLSSVWMGPKHYVLYQAWPAPMDDSPKHDQWTGSNAFIYRLYNKKYGMLKGRKVASHVPILLDTSVMQKIKDDFPEEFKAMYHRKPFRTFQDMQIQFAYQQYIIQHFPHMIVTKQHVHFVTTLDHSSVNSNKRQLNGIRNRPLQYICIQDDFKKSPTVEVINQLQDFYEDLFPNRAPWERD